VVKPDFESLTKEDIVLVFPNDVKIVDEINVVLSKAEVGKILYSDDLKKLTPMLTYPTLFGCKLI
jgi:hypothetical protein